MFNSKKFWNERYLNGGNSGSGSYNHLAHFKANVINQFIKNNSIKSIIDYGVGDGLYKHFNSKKNSNINAFKNTIKKIKECGM